MTPTVSLALSFAIIALTVFFIGTALFAMRVCWLAFIKASKRREEIIAEMEAHREELRRGARRTDKRFELDPK